MLEPRRASARREHGPPVVGRLAVFQELALVQRIEPAGRLVEDQDLRPVHERLDDSKLLSVALRKLPDRTVEDAAEPLDERVPRCVVDASSESPERVQLLPAGQPVGETQVARQVADPSPSLDVAPGIEPCDGGLSGRRTNQVEKETDGRALAGAVRPEVAEDLPALDAQVEVDSARTPFGYVFDRPRVSMAGASATGPS